MEHFSFFFFFMIHILHVSVQVISKKKKRKKQHFTMHWNGVLTNSNVKISASNRTTQCRTLLRYRNAFYKEAIANSNHMLNHLQLTINQNISEHRLSQHFDIRMTVNKSNKLWTEGVTIHQNIMCTKWIGGIWKNIHRE